MAEFFNVDEPIVFENKTDSNFDVDMGIIFHKSGIYEVSILENRTVVSKVTEPKIGKWIFGHTLGHSWMKCSECLVSQDGQTACFSYCPNCGAKMEGEKNG